MVSEGSAGEQDTEPPAERSPIASLVWAAYGLSGRLAAPLARPYLHRRARRGKEDPERLTEKLGAPSRAPFAQRPVWLHAVSVGESVAALTLAERLVGEGANVVLTTSTRTAAQRVSAALRQSASVEGEPRGLVHQYAPLDAPPFVDAFVAHWRPRLALFTEAEVWPTTLFRLAAARVPRGNVNARLSERSFRRWSAWPQLSRALFGELDLVLAQSASHAERFARLGVRRARVCGNLKFDAAPPVADEARLAALRAAVGDRPLWLAASTHDGEEAVALAAHAQLRERIPNLLTVIAPRHPERGEAVAALARRTGRTTRRSRDEPPSGAIFVADTLGELGTLFALSPVVFLGGSLVPLGGHNPAEPAAAGAALLTGPSHGEMFEPFVAADAAQVVTDAASLTVAVDTLLNDRPARQARARAARGVLAQERGAVERTIAALADLTGHARSHPA